MRCRPLPQRRKTSGNLSCHKQDHSVAVPFRAAADTRRHSLCVNFGPSVIRGRLSRGLYAYRLAQKPETQRGSDHGDSRDAGSIPARSTMNTSNQPTWEEINYAQPYPLSQTGAHCSVCHQDYWGNHWCSGPYTNQQQFCARCQGHQGTIPCHHCPQHCPPGIQPGGQF